MNIPFSFKLEKRLGASRMLGVFVLLTSTVLALLLGAVLLMVFDANPWDTYKAMFQGAFGTQAVSYTHLRAHETLRNLV